MKTTLNRQTDKKLLITLDELAAMLSCGLVTARKAGEESGARVQIGRRVLYSVDKIERYISGLTT